MPKLLTTEEQQRFQRQSNESVLTYADRVGDLIRAEEPLHPNPGALYNFEKDEPDMVPVYAGNTVDHYFIEMFVPSAEYRADSDTDACLPPYRILDTTDDDDDVLASYIDHHIPVYPWYAYVGIASETAFRLSELYSGRRFTVTNCLGGWIESCADETYDWDA